MKNFKFIDLFCGIGGFHQAMTDLGGKCVYACDIDAECRKIYGMSLYGGSNLISCPGFLFGQILYA